jgi:hypothetical protein
MKKKVFIFLIAALLMLMMASCTNNYLAGLEDKNAINEIAKTNPQMALDVAQQAAETGDVEAAVSNTAQSIVTTLSTSTGVATEVAEAMESVNPTQISTALAAVSDTDSSTEDLVEAQNVLSDAASSITKAASELQAQLTSGSTISEEAKANIQTAAKVTVKAIATKHGFTMDNIASNATGFIPKDVSVDATMTSKITDFLASLISTFPTNGEVEFMMAMQKLARASNVTPESTLGTFNDPMMAVTLSMDEMVHIFYQLVDTNSNGYLDSGDAIWPYYQEFLKSKRDQDALTKFSNEILGISNPFKGNKQKFKVVELDIYDIIYNLKIGINALADLVPDIDVDSAVSDLNVAKTQLDSFFSSGFDVTSYDSVGDLINAIVKQF